MSSVSSGSLPSAAGGTSPGDVVAQHFRVERVLGSGGMGVVVAAIDERSGQRVAIKLLRFGNEERQIERFLREARTMGRLSTPHVVKVLEAGSHDGKPFLVMERLQGRDLADLARERGVLGVREVADCILQACEALSHAHASGIVHRDVKPSNLFLHEEPSGKKILKVLDFGISKVVRGPPELTLTSSTDGGVLGSPPYMSPEQVRDPKTVDARTDIWSLGVVMYKLLSGGVPFGGESVGEMFARVLERTHPSLRTSVALPLELDAIVGKCLAKDRRERWPHVGDLAAALAPFASPEHAALAPAILDRLRDEARTEESPQPVCTGNAAAPPGAHADGRAVETVDGEVATSAGASASIAPTPPASGRPWLGFALVAVGVAAGLGIGVAVRTPAPSSSPAAAVVASPPPPNGSVLSAAAPPPPSTTSAAAATSAAPAVSMLPSAPLPSPPDVLRAKPAGRKPATSPSSISSRSELQPSPYAAP